MKRTTLSFRCPEVLLKDLDSIADHNYMDRTGVIIQAVLNYLRSSDAQSPAEPEQKTEK